LVLTSFYFSTYFSPPQIKAYCLFYHSMTGPPLDQLKEAVLSFIEVTEKLELGMRIGLVQFSSTANLLVPVSNDYLQLRQAVNGLIASGGMRRILIAWNIC